MLPLRQYPRYTCDRPNLDINALKPRLLRAALVALAKTDGLFWKGHTTVRSIEVNFEVTLPHGFKKDKGETPSERFNRLERLEKALGERFNGHPAIFNIKNKINLSLAKLAKGHEIDLVNLLDDLDDYEDLLNESREETNRYFYGLFIKIVNGFQFVKVPNKDYCDFVDYNSNSIIRETRLAKKLDEIWKTADKVLPYLKHEIAGELMSTLRRLNRLVGEYPLTEGLSRDIAEVEEFIAQNIHEVSVDSIFAETDALLQNHPKIAMKMAQERNKLVFQTEQDDAKLNLKLALLYLKYKVLAETTQATPHPQIIFKYDPHFCWNRLDVILNYISAYTNAYVDSHLRMKEMIKRNGIANCYESIIEFEKRLVQDAAVIEIFKKNNQKLSLKSCLLPKCESARSSMLINLNRAALIQAFYNMVTIYKRMS